jgi:hypothetical protein
MIRQIILTSEGKHEAVRKDPDNDLPENPSTDKSSPEITRKEKPKGNKGMLIVDATVADQMIAYPTDLGLIVKSGKKAKGLLMTFVRYWLLTKNLEHTDGLPENNI